MHLCFLCQPLLQVQDGWWQMIQALRQRWALLSSLLALQLLLTTCCMVLPQSNFAVLTFLPKASRLPELRGDDKVSPLQSVRCTPSTPNHTPFLCFEQTRGLSSYIFISSDFCFSYMYPIKRPECRAPLRAQQPPAGVTLSRRKS